VRVILDTNIFVSALISSSGPPARLVDAWADGSFILVSHAVQLAELREVTRRGKIRPLIRATMAGRLVNQIGRLADIPETLPPVERSPDPRDDFLLALCEAGDANWLATGDKADLLALGRHGETRIVTAARLAAELGLEA
jgi:hypothetical protein